MKVKLGNIPGFSKVVKQALAQKTAWEKSIHGPGRARIEFW